MTPLRVGIVGCTGRMGRSLVRLIAADPELCLSSAVTIPNDPLLGQDAGLIAGVSQLGQKISTQIDGAADVLIEFSSPAGTVQWAGWCADRKTPLVSGTTGLDDAANGALSRAAKLVPILWAANMSVGVNLLLKLVAEATALTGETWDVEITEAHHHHKVDAPSGTAKALLDRVVNNRNLNPATAPVYGRHGAPGPRKTAEVGVHALRMGEIIGEHEVHFASPTEVLTLGHRALSRDAFAAGALHAAKWLVRQKPALYTMQDMLSLSRQTPL